MPYMQVGKRDARWHGALFTSSDDRFPAMGRTFLAAFLAACASVAIPAVSPAPTPSAVLPAPPYPRFAGVTFEPSAAAFDPASGRVLVLSDHDTTLYRYELGSAGLVLPPGEHHDPLRLPKGLEAAKFEGLTRLPSGEFLAVTAFDRPDPAFRRLLRFTYAPGAPAEAVPLAVNDVALATAVRTASGLPWFKIEALAVDRSGTRVFFGVRNVGETYKAPRDVVLVVRCPPHQPRRDREQAGGPLGAPLQGSGRCASGCGAAGAGPALAFATRLAGQARGTGGSTLRGCGRGLRRRP
jgi:hypothetical protein